MKKVKITGVAETMLQTLYARAAYSQKINAKFYDGKSVEIVSQLDYDFSKAAKDAAMSSGVIARTILLDAMAEEFVKQNPNGTVINIACGMDTRFYRVDNGSIRWYNIDLPETIAVRKLFLSEEGRVSQISRSAMDEAWAKEIGKPQGKVLVVIEGLTMYLTQADVQKILSIIAANFPDAEVIVETMNPLVVNNFKEKSIEATTAKFTWGIKNGKELIRLAPEFEWVRDLSLTEGMKIMYPIYHLIGWIPVIKTISNRLVVLHGRSDPQ